MKKKLKLILWLLPAVLLIAAVMPVTAMAQSTGYGYEVIAAPAPAAIGSEVSLTVRLTDYAEDQSGIRGFQIDIEDVDDVLHSAVCTSLVTDADNVLADDAKYQSSRDMVRHLFAKESGTLDYGQTDLLEVRFVIPRTYTEAGVLELPMTLLIQNEAGEKLTYHHQIQIAYAPASELPADDAAMNSSTGSGYTSLADALDDAGTGETVVLLADCSEDRVMVTPGVVLDLNGFALTANYAVAFDTGHIIDSTEQGRMNIDMKNVVLDEENSMVPVYDGEGYIFTKAGFAIKQDSSYEGDGIKINALAYPTRMEMVELLKNGGTDNDVQIVIRLSWDTADGTGSQEFLFTDQIVESVYNSNDGSWAGYSKMFSMVITGFANIENLRANMVIVSGTGTQYVSSTSISIT